MRQLQDLGATNTTAIYTQLGRELQQELEILQQSGDERRLQEVRASFEQFLQQIYQSRDPSNVGALLWIGETYAGLAGGADDKAAASASISKAVTVFEELLNSNPDEATTAAVQLRLMRAYRQLGRFDAAVQLGTEVLESRPASVSVQLEVAHILADWGEAGEPDRLLESISGIPADQQQKVVWGWAALSRRLQRSQGAENWQDLKPLFLEARYELSRSRLRYARVSPDQGQRQLEAAARELTSMVQVLGNLDDAWMTRFDQLYQDIQAQLGRPGVALSRPNGTATGPNGSDSETGNDPDNNGDSPANSQQSDSNSAGDGSGSQMTLLIGGISLMAVIVAAVSFFVMRRPTKRVRRSLVGQPADFQLPGGESAETGGTRRPSSSGSARPTRPPAEQPRSAGSKTRSRPGAESGSGKAPAPRRKKRPRPPENE